MFTKEQIYKAICPNCKKDLDSISHEQDRLPKPDDLSVCIYCGELLKFDENLCLILPNEDGIIELMQTDSWIKIRRTQDVIFRMIKEKNTNKSIGG